MSNNRSVLTASDAAPSQVYPTNTLITPFNIGLGGRVTGGTPTWQVQHTFDDVFSPTFDPGTATWYTHSSLTGQTGAADGNYAFPVTGIRVRVTAGTGTVALTVVPAGISNS